MANIAVARIKREFKEVVKSEEVRNACCGSCALATSTLPGCYLLCFYVGSAPSVKQFTLCCAETGKRSYGCTETLRRPHRRLKYSQPAGVATLTV